jgi:hypothetical protein
VSVFVSDKYPATVSAVTNFALSSASKAPLWSLKYVGVKGFCWQTFSATVHGAFDES